MWKTKSLQIKTKLLKNDITSNTCTNSRKNMYGEQIPSSPGLFITWLKDNLPYVYLIMVAVDINFLNVLWLIYHIFNIKKHNDRNLTNTAVRIPCHYCFSYKEHCNIFQVFVNITLSGPLIPSLCMYLLSILQATYE